MRKAPAVPSSCLIDLDVIIGITINFAGDKKNESKGALAIEKSTRSSCQECDIYWFNNPTVHLCTNGTVYCVHVLPLTALAMVWNQQAKLVKRIDCIVHVAAKTHNDVPWFKTSPPYFDGIKTAHRCALQHEHEQFELQYESPDYLKLSEELALFSDIRLLRYSHAPLPPIER